MHNDVICPNCNEVFHETTAEFNPDVNPNGSMLRLKDRYRADGWDSFVEDSSSIQDELCCPSCGGQYIEGHPGRLRTADSGRASWAGTAYAMAEPTGSKSVKRRKASQMELPI